jgi:hypothetical protein
MSSPGSGTPRHHLGPSDPPGLDADAIEFLRTHGIPAELRLAGWAGPTLFTSAIADGALRRNAGGEWVLGTIRETQGHSGAAAEFVIRGAQVVLIDENGAWPANSSVAQFVRSIEAFHTAFAALPDGAEAGRSVLDEVERIDPVAFARPAGYWAMWVEEFRGD